MKSFLCILLCVYVSATLTCQAQYQPKVQDTFWGNKYGSSILEMKDVIIKKNLDFEEKESPKSLLVTPKGKNQLILFGGLTFSIIEYYFSNEGLYRCSFSNSYANKSEAMNFYKELTRKLLQKYPLSSNNESTTTLPDYLYYQDTDNIVSVSYQVLNTKHGMARHYVFLTYCNKMRFENVKNNVKRNTSIPEDEL